RQILHRRARAIGATLLLQTPEVIPYPAGDQTARAGLAQQLVQAMVPGTPDHRARLASDNRSFRDRTIAPGVVAVERLALRQREIRCHARDLDQLAAFIPDLQGHESLRERRWRTGHLRFHAAGIRRPGIARGTGFSRGPGIVASDADAARQAQAVLAGPQGIIEG